MPQVLATARSDPTMAAQLTWARRLGMACDAAAGMLYLHTRTPSPIVHRGELQCVAGWVGKAGAALLVGGRGASAEAAAHFGRRLLSLPLPSASTDLKSPNLLVDTSWVVKAGCCGVGPGAAAVATAEEEARGWWRHGMHGWATMPMGTCGSAAHCPPAAFPAPQVTDFGIARIVEDATHSGSSMAAMNPVRRTVDAQGRGRE